MYFMQRLSCIFQQVNKDLYISNGGLNCLALNNMLYILTSKVGVNGSFSYQMFE